MLAAEDGYGIPTLPRTLESHLHARQRSRPLPAVSTGYRAAQWKQLLDGLRAWCPTSALRHPMCRCGRGTRGVETQHQATNPAAAGVSRLPSDEVGAGEAGSSWRHRLGLR